VSSNHQSRSDCENRLRVFAIFSNFRPDEQLCMRISRCAITKLRTSSARTSRLRLSTNHNFPSYDCSQGFVRRSYFIERHDRTTVIVPLWSHGIQITFTKHHCTLTLITRTRALVRHESWRGILSQTSIRESRHITSSEVMCAPWVILNITELILERNMGSILPNQHIVT